MVEDIDARIAALYGPQAPTQMRAFRGLLHVAAVWAGDPSWPAILIRPDGPRSASDRFALELARARADAIVITGKILREELDLHYGQPGAGTSYQAALTQWRAQALGKREPPRLAILSSGRAIDLDHPVFRSWVRPLLLVDAAHAEPLRLELSEGGLEQVELLALERPSLPATLELLRERGAETISLEAGPRTLAPLYTQAEGPGVDELMLSLFRGELPERLRGGSFVDRARAEALFECVAEAEREGSSGPWSFTRWAHRA